MDIDGKTKELKDIDELEFELQAKIREAKKKVSDHRSHSDQYKLQFESIRPPFTIPDQRNERMKLAGQMTFHQAQADRWQAILDALYKELEEFYLKQEGVSSLNTFPEKEKKEVMQ